MERHLNTSCQAADLVPEAPASVQAVLCALEDHEPKTNKVLQEETGLPRRTLYTALRRLQEDGLVKRRVSLQDTRQTYFWLPEMRASAAS
ncbi:MAG: winged helix-turn-helix transcriptional regulator [Thermoplasmatota archaeon]